MICDFVVNRLWKHSLRIYVFEHCTETFRQYSMIYFFWWKAKRLFEPTTRVLVGGNYHHVDHFCPRVKRRKFYSVLISCFVYFSHLNGAVLETLSRPALLITDAYTAVHAQARRRERDIQLMSMFFSIDFTLRKNFA